MGWAKPSEPTLKLGVNIGWQQLHALALSGKDLVVVADQRLELWDAQSMRWRRSLEPSPFKDWASETIGSRSGQQVNLCQALIESEILALKCHVYPGVQLWSLKTGKYLGRLNRHLFQMPKLEPDPNDHLLSASNGRIAFKSFRPRLKIWDRRSGQLRHSLEWQSPSIQKLTIAENRLFCLLTDHSLVRYSLETGERQLLFPAAQTAIRDFEIEDQTLVMLYADNHIEAWDLNGQKRIYNLKGKARPDHPQISQAITNRSFLGEFDYLPHEFAQMALAPGYLLTQGTGKWGLDLRALKTGKLLAHFEAETPYLLNPNSRFEIQGKTLKFTDTHNPQLEALQLRSADEWPNTEPFLSSENGGHLAVGLNRGAIYLFRGQDLQREKSIPAFSHSLDHLALQADTVVGSGLDEVFEVWDLKTQKPLFQLENPANTPYTALALGSQKLALTNAKRLSFFAAENGQFIGSHPAPALEKISALHWLGPDLWLGGQGGSLYHYEANRNLLDRHFSPEAKPSSPTSEALHFPITEIQHSGELLVLGYQEGHLAIWDITARQFRFEQLPDSACGSRSPLLALHGPWLFHACERGGYQTWLQKRALNTGELQADFNTLNVYTANRLAESGKTCLYQTGFANKKSLSLQCLELPSGQHKTRWQKKPSVAEEILDYQAPHLLLKAGNKLKIIQSQTGQIWHIPNGYHPIDLSHLQGSVMPNYQVKQADLLSYLPKTTQKSTETGNGSEPVGLSCRDLNTGLLRWQIHWPGRLEQTGQNEKQFWALTSQDTTAHMYFARSEVQPPPLLMGQDFWLTAWDLKTGKQRYHLKLGDERHLHIAGKQHLLLSSKPGFESKVLEWVDLNSGKQKKIKLAEKVLKTDLGEPGLVAVLESGKLAIIDPTTDKVQKILNQHLQGLAPFQLQIKDLQLGDGVLIAHFWEKPANLRHPRIVLDWLTNIKEHSFVWKMPEGKLSLRVQAPLVLHTSRPGYMTLRKGTSLREVWDLETGKTVSKYSELYFTDGLLLYTPQGYFTGLGAYRSYLHLLKDHTLTSEPAQLKRFERPDLVYRALRGESLATWPQMPIRSDPDTPH